MLSVVEQSIEPTIQAWARAGRPQAARDPLFADDFLRKHVLDPQISIGRRGKDTAWAPTALTMMEKMLDLAGVTVADTVVDLGSGDGRMVIAAAKRGARGIGVELDPALLVISRRAAECEGVADRATFVQHDLLKFDLSRGSVITMYLGCGLNHHIWTPPEKQGTDR